MKARNLKAKSVEKAAIQTCAQAKASVQGMICGNDHFGYRHRLDILASFFAIFLLSASLSAQAHYRHNGVALENDLKFTPGSIRVTTKQELCTTKTGLVRDVKAADRRQAFALYGIDCKEGHCGRWEIDHLISLEISGDNSVANLWPQPYKSPGAHQKDILENLLHKMICDGTITPADAQHQIAADWYAAYKRYVKPTDGKLGR